MTEGRKVQRLLWVTPPLSETESEREFEVLQGGGGSGQHISHLFGPGTNVSGLVFGSLVGPVRPDYFGSKLKNHPK
jgi:hypothetical protein